MYKLCWTPTESKARIKEAITFKPICKLIFFNIEMHYKHYNYDKIELYLRYVVRKQAS